MAYEVPPKIAFLVSKIKGLWLRCLAVASIVEGDRAQGCQKPTNGWNAHWPLPWTAI
jgi:hypothetical protein